MTTVISLRANSFEFAVTFHSAFLPKALTPHVEGFAPLGYSWLTRKISENVLFEGSGAVQQGHDSGYLLPHLGVPNWMLAVHSALSKCAVCFGKSTVLVNKEPAGWWAPYAMFQVCMEPIPAPFGVNVSALFTSVMFGLAADDLVRGYVRVMHDIVAGLAAERIIGLRSPRLPFRLLLDRLASKLGPGLGRTLGRHVPAVAQVFHDQGKLAGAFAHGLMEALRGHFLSEWIITPATSQGQIGRGKWTSPALPGLSRDIWDVLSGVPILE